MVLRNLCIELTDPCQPIWKLEVQKLALIRKQLHREEGKKESAFKLDENIQLVMDGSLIKVRNIH